MAALCGLVEGCASAGLTCPVGVQHFIGSERRVWAWDDQRTVSRGRVLYCEAGAAPSLSAR